MINVEIIDSNSPRITKKQYQYTEFDEATSKMVDGQYVVFVLEKKGKKLYKGRFDRFDSESAHLDIVSKVGKLIDDGLVNKKQGKRLMSELDKEFQELIADENDFESIDEQDSSPIHQVEDQLSKGKSLKQHDEAPRTTKKRRLVLSKNLKSYLLFMIVLLVIGLSFSFLRTISFSDSQETTESSVMSLKNLLQKKDYFQAAELYPNDIKAIEGEIVKNQDFGELKNFNTKYPTDVGSFDLAFYEERWKDVVNTEISLLDNDRKVMLALAFLKLDQIDEAVLLNESLKSEILEKEIKNKQFQKAIVFLQQGKTKEAEAIQSVLNDDDLAVLIDTNKEYDKLIKLNKDKKNEDEVEKWKKRQEKIGEEFLNEREGNKDRL